MRRLDPLQRDFQAVVAGLRALAQRRIPVAGPGGGEGGAIDPGVAVGELGCPGGGAEKKQKNEDTDEARRDRCGNTETPTHPVVRMRARAAF